jgi:putative hydrolase of the HAD superfamily
VHVPYHTTWAHEADATLRHGAERMRSIAGIADLAQAVQELDAIAAR